MYVAMAIARGQSIHPEILGWHEGNQISKIPDLKRNAAGLELLGRLYFLPALKYSLVEPPSALKFEFDRAKENFLKTVQKSVSKLRIY